MYTVAYVYVTVYFEEGAMSATRVLNAPTTVVGFPADYWDCFRTAASPGPADAREWARMSLRGAEAHNGRFSRLVWQGILGLRLAPIGTAETVAGWRITHETPDELVLDADGRLMTGRMVFALSGPDLTWTTMLDFHRPPARLIWSLVAPFHRALVPRCLATVH